MGVAVAKVSATRIAEHVITQVGDHPSELFNLRSMPTLPVQAEKEIAKE